MSTTSTAFERPITEVMTRDVVWATPRFSVASIADLMMRHHIGCVPIVDERRRPRGIVTKWDLIELLDTRHPDNETSFASRTADDVMMPLAMTLGENATVAHAASMMALEGFHHVMVVSQSGELVGLVSSHDIVKWVAASEGITRTA